MSFGGTVQSMIISLKNNKRRSRQTIYSKERHTTSTNLSKSWKKVLEKKASPEQLEETRQQIAKENKERLVKTFIVFFAVIGLATVVVLLFW